MAVRAGYAPGCGLEEEFGTLRRIDAVIEVASAGILRFLHPGAAAAVVGHARRPDLLVFDGRFDLRGREVLGGLALLHESRKIASQIVVGDKRVPGSLGNPVILSMLLNKSSLARSIEVHNF